jgi:hypothetical protein
MPSADALAEKANAANATTPLCFIPCSCSNQFCHYAVD